MSNQAPLHYWNTPGLGLFNYAYFLSPALILCLFKAKSHVCTLEDDWRRAECLRMSCNKPFSTFHHVSLLTYRGK
jgi:hypothetical protein